MVVIVCSARSRTSRRAAILPHSAGADWRWRRRMGRGARGLVRSASTTGRTTSRTSGEKGVRLAGKRRRRRGRRRGVACRLTGGAGAAYLAAAFRPGPRPDRALASTGPPSMNNIGRYMGRSPDTLHRAPRTASKASGACLGSRRLARRRPRRPPRHLRLHRTRQLIHRRRHRRRCRRRRQRARRQARQQARPFRLRPSSPAPLWPCCWPRRSASS